MSLRKQTIHGIAFTGLQNIGLRCVNLITSVILARLIAPEEFGLMAILMVFQAFAQVLMDAGFGQALIQKKELTESDRNAVFFYNIVSAGLIAGILYFSAPFIAAFYGHDVLEPMLRFFSFGIIILSFGSVPRALLMREMRFKALTVVALTSTVVSAAVSILLAWKGFGVWALLVGSMGKFATDTTGRWVVGKWVPSWQFDLSALKGLFGFSSKLLLLTLLGNLTEQMYSLIIGKLYPMATLGFFQRAKNLRQMGVQTFSQPMNLVMFPSFSKLQNDHEKLRRVFLESLDVAMLIYVPLVLGLGAVSNQLIPLLYGERWIPAARYLSILCWAAVFMPVTTFHSSLIKALGFAGLRLKAELIVSPITLILIACAAPFGVTVMVWTVVVQGWLWAVVMRFFSYKAIKVPVVTELIDVFRIFLIGSVLFASVFFLPRCLGDLPLVLVFLVQVLVGILIYGIAIRLFAVRTVKLFLETVSDIAPSWAIRGIGKVLCIN